MGRRDPHNDVPVISFAQCKCGNKVFISSCECVSVNFTDTDHVPLLEEEYYNLLYKSHIQNLTARCTEVFQVSKVLIKQKVHL